MRSDKTIRLGLFEKWRAAPQVEPNRRRLRPGRQYDLRETAEGAAAAHDRLKDVARRSATAPSLLAPEGSAEDLQQPLGKDLGGCQVLACDQVPVLNHVRLPNGPTAVLHTDLFFQIRLTTV
ncbi:hypothetical protein [Streptomyces sp. NPDC093594]|uniref:hypothetical protein n=1 Tax=Streptomyces sp. NPDC093594 TaxID=3155305 RepID=UPI00344CEB92